MCKVSVKKHFAEKLTYCSKIVFIKTDRVLTKI